MMSIEELLDRVIYGVPDTDEEELEFLREMCKHDEEWDDGFEEDTTIQS